MSDVLDIIDTAAQTQDWLVLAVASVLLIVPIVLKALGKRVPLVDGAIKLAVGILKSRKPKEPPAPQSGETQGIPSVVPVTDAEKPKAVEDLK